MKSKSYTITKEHNHCGGANWCTRGLPSHGGHRMQFCESGMNVGWPKLRKATKARATLHFEKPPRAKRSFTMGGWSMCYVEVHYNDGLRNAQSLQVYIHTGTVLKEVTDGQRFWVTMEVLT